MGTTLSVPGVGTRSTWAFETGDKRWMLRRSVMSNPRGPGSELRWLASVASHSHVRSYVSELGE